MRCTASAANCAQFWWRTLTAWRKRTKVPSAVIVRHPLASKNQVCTSLQVQSWLKRLIDERDDLLSAIPARSHEPGCYKALIYAAAEQVLHAGMSGDVAEADTNDMLRASYPEYFQQPGTAPNTCDQRFRRARMDVRALLRSVVSHDELF